MKFKKLIYIYFFNTAEDSTVVISDDKKDKSDKKDSSTDDADKKKDKEDKKEEKEKSQERNTKPKIDSEAEKKRVFFYKCLNLLCYI